MFSADCASTVLGGHHAEVVFLADAVLGLQLPLTKIVEILLAILLPGLAACFFLALLATGA